MVMALWEVVSPRRVLTQPKSQRWPINLGVVVLNAFLLKVIPGFSGTAAAIFAADKGLGFFHLWPLPSPIPFILGILILDFAIYLQHVLFHPPYR